MGRAELRGKLLPGRETDPADKALALAASFGGLRLDSARAALDDFRVTYSDKARLMKEAFEAALREAPFAPPDVDALRALFPKDRPRADAVLDAMTAEGALILAIPGTVFHREAVDAALMAIRRLTADGPMTLAAFRDALQTSRKSALALLEYFDRKGVTVKQGDARVLRN
jgi:selenocysteine-specific elongation factor